MTATGKLSPKFSELALGCAIEEVRGFKEFCVLPNDPKQVLLSVTDRYILGAKNEAETEQRLAETERLKGLLSGDTKRRTLKIDKGIKDILIPICISVTEIEREKELERRRAFNKITKPYIDLASFIIEQTRTTPPRLTIPTASGLLLGFGLRSRIGSNRAAVATAANATLRAKSMIRDSLVGINFVNDREETQDSHPKEFKEGAWYLSRLIGCTSQGSRIGYRPLNAGEPFSHVVQTVAENYGQFTPNNATRAAKVEVSRVTGYVLDKILPRTGVY